MRNGLLAVGAVAVAVALYVVLGSGAEGKASSENGKENAVSKHGQPGEVDGSSQSTSGQGATSASAKPARDAVKSKSGASSPRGPRPSLHAIGKDDDERWAAFDETAKRLFPKRAERISAIHKDVCSNVDIATDADDIGEDLLPMLMSVVMTKDVELAKVLAEDELADAKRRLAWPLIRGCFGEKKAAEIKKVMVQMQEETGIELPWLQEDET